MLELLPTIQRWRQEGKRCALGRLVKVWGSAPRPVGSCLAVSSEGEIEGSVSGGCVEGAVVEAALEVLESGEARLLEFGVSDEQAWSVGLSCGGEIEVFVEPYDEGPEAQDVVARLEEALGSRRTVALALVLSGPNVGRRLLLDDQAARRGDLGDEVLNRRARELAVALRSEFGTRRVTVPTAAAKTEIFVQIFAPSPTLLLVGAGHVAIPLVHYANQLGFHTVVIDPRSAFATPERFAHADSLIQKWPDKGLEGQPLDEGTYLAVLSHDLKLDVPALAAALRGNCRYIGALGSRKTHGKRLAALREEGFSDEELEVIHSPIGWPIGGRQAPEIALSIITEIVAVQHGTPRP